ncbi:CLUMA_CG007442, isoform A [Clunio marinus]|uniref:Dipeptidase n=1 Tax=Clunio marinus TaxID=568069 RepID=A0A1J1I135_9DIPT|nr:CLUMA_CG007442, isoform A [Clunio marinus]
MVIPSQSRPLYQYSLDRKRPLHTYTCEQNAQILLRLERERQRKYGSSGRLTQHFTGVPNADYNLKPQANNVNRNDTGSLNIDFNANNRMSGCPETNHIENEVFIGDVNRVNGISIKTEDNTIPPNFPPPPIKSMLRRNSSITKHQPMNVSANPVINQNPSIEFTRPNSSTLPLNKPDLFNFANAPTPMLIEGMKGCPPLIDDNVKQSKAPPHSDANISHTNTNNCQSKLAYPLIFCDDHQMYDKENSFYLYHHEPASYLPNYDNISSKYPEKYNTMECSGPMFPLQHFNIPISKLHASTCNLNNQFNSSNLINDHHFSNSLSNFNMMDPHQQIQNYYNFNPSFTQLPDTMRRGGGVGGMPTGFGSSSIIGSSFASNISLNGTPKQQANMPWKHRQCSSRSSSSGTNSSKWDLPSRQWLALTSILLIAGAASVAVPLALSVTAGSPFEERFQAALRFLEQVPLIDGHNDLPWNIRKFMHNQINDFRFDDDLKTISPWANSSWSHTDLQRLKRGRITAQFWAAYVPCEAQYKDAVQITLEQIDIIERLTDRYSPQMTKCSSVYDINQAHKNRQICSLIGVEGGHSLGGSLGVLRTFYSLGVRYMTLTSTCHTPWADSSNADAPKYDVKHGGLTAYGKIIVREMNRLGMAVDLSKASVKTMRDVLAITEAPIIFSHSSAFGLCNSSRNVHDEILKLVTKNGGLVMVNFYNKFLSCNENATVHDAVAHINYIKSTAGIDHVGLGAGFDGINFTPKGIDDVSAYPYLFAELMGHGWTAEELTKLAGGNLLRVLSEVRIIIKRKSSMIERVRDMKRMNNEKPFEDIPNFRLPLQTSDEQLYNCSNTV